MSDRNPWAVLGLAVGTTDELEIRRAYAERVRESPPEKDPEGFRRVRDAYEQLKKGDPVWLKYLADEAEGRDPDEAYDDEEEDDDGTSADGPGSVELLEVVPTHDVVLVASWREMIASALARTDAGRAVSVQSAVAAAARQAEESAANLSALAGALRDEPFAKHEAELAGALPAWAVRASLERGDGALAAWAVEALSLAGNTDALGRAADAAAELKDVREPAAIHALVGLARAAALVSPKSAKRLADLAWAQAAPAVRPRLSIEIVDFAAAAAKDVADWPPVDRALLARIVYAGGVEGEVDPQRFHQRLARARRSDQARRLVREVAPELMPKVLQYPKRKADPAPDANKRQSWVQGLISLLVLVGAVSRLSKCGDDKPYRPLYDSTRWTNSRLELDRFRRSGDVLTPADRRELDELHQKIARRDKLLLSERRRFKDLTGRHLGSASLGGSATRPLSDFERNELAAYRARVASGEPLSEIETRREASLNVREKIQGILAPEHPPDADAEDR